MKKIGIATLPGNCNYGNRLQNYAFEDTLISMNLEVKTILPPRKRFIEKIHKSPSKLFLSILRKIKPVFRPKGSFAKMNSEKEKKLAPFTDQNLHNIHWEDIIIDDFDLIFVGSDQVWNPNFMHNEKFFFLDFIDQNKRFSYAASFGINEISDAWSDEFSTQLKKMNKISVREERGVELVRELSGRDASLVPDPTLLLTPLKWNIFADTADFSSKEKYIILYFLGDVKSDMKVKISEYAEKNKFKIITIMGDRYNPTHWVPTVFEFAAAIRGAEAVFTDSFHSSVFSIIYNTPFVTFNRDDSNMISRIDTLLGYFDLSDNHYTGAMSFEEIIKQTNFENVPVVLERERNKGLGFIQSCLDTIE